MCNEKTLLIFLNKKLIFLKIFFLKEKFNSFRGKENLIFLFSLILENVLSKKNNLF